MQTFFSDRRERLFKLKARREQGSHAPKTESGAPCPVCNAVHTAHQRAAALMVCPACGHHFPMGAYHRLSVLLDAHTFRELDADLRSTDPLQFPDYPQKLQTTRVRTGLQDAAVSAKGKIGGHSAIVVVLDSRFFMGSMGAVMGEKIARAAARAQKAKVPLVLFTASGGARMQEGIVSLMQMAKTSAALQRFSEAGGLTIVCLTHPTTGGVTASFASLGDITLAEPNALIGFAGPRVIEQTIGQTLPQGFQRAEFLQAHGFVDKIVPRSAQRETLLQLFKLHARRRT